MSYVIALDCGTTSVRALLFDETMQSIAIEQQEINIFHPQEGWVEQDPLEIWNQTNSCLSLLISKQRLSVEKVSCVGLTNQREAFLLWNRKTGLPVTKLIGWQDLRSTDLCSSLKECSDIFQKRTGLPLDPYFSGSKLSHFLKENPEILKSCLLGELYFGTLDSWILFKLTGVHATEPSNASRTLLYDIHKEDWHRSLFTHLEIPVELKEILFPTILDSNAHFGTLTEEPLKGVPITGVLGDQQAALLGHSCIKKGDIKSTYGTGCFSLKNIGSSYEQPPRGLLGTVAWRWSGGSTVYAWEGSVKMAGATIQFLRDNLKILKNVNEIDKMLSTIKDNGGVYFVPAFAGLGSPHWDSSARGSILGMDLSTTAAHIVRAALESTAYQSFDMLRFFGETTLLSIDGGVSQNEWFTQFLADILQEPIWLQTEKECTARGAAINAAIGAGIMTLESIPTGSKTKIKPQMKKEERLELLLDWGKAISKAKGWLPA